MIETLRITICERDFPKWADQGRLGEMFRSNYIKHLHKIAELSQQDVELIAPHLVELDQQRLYFLPYHPAAKEKTK